MKNKTELNALKVIKTNGKLIYNTTISSLFISRSLEAMLYYFNNRNVYKVNAQCIHTEAGTIMFNIKYNDIRVKKRRIHLRIAKERKYEK